MSSHGKKKIGRNSPCPCDSGLKYKNCCGKITNDSPLWQLNKLENVFEKYDSKELISVLGGLQLCPDNQSQIPRLEVASRIACKNISDGKENINPIILKDQLKTLLPPNCPIGRLEDPLEGLFTDNIMFFDGNYTVYSGTYHVEPCIINNLLETLFLNKDDFPEEFMLRIYSATICLLKLINEVANRMGHNRYMIGVDRWRQNINVPDNIQSIRNISNAVTFSKEEIEDLLPIEHDFIKQFVLLIGDEAFNETEVNNNPLIKMPLVQIGDKFILASSGSITSTLRQYTWVMAMHYGVLGLLLNKLREKLWINVNEHLRWMDFEYLDYNLPVWECNLSFEEGVYKIDTDKFAYVVLLTDDLSDFKPDEAYGMWDSTKYTNLLNKRCKIITELLTNQNSDNCQELLIIALIGQIGRFGMLGLDKIPNSHGLIMTTEEFEVVAKTRKCDNLTLWKFSKALDEYKHGPVSFLDQFALYSKNNQSFYLSDYIKPKILFIPPDPEGGRLERHKVAKLWDTHNVLYNDDPLYSKVFRMENGEPIYYDQVRGETLIEGYKPPLWVKFHDDIHKIHDLRPLCFDYLTTISYWLWQFTPDLKFHLNAFGNSAIHFILGFKDLKIWLNDELVDTKKPLEFEFIINDMNVNFEIPYEIISITRRPDNLADREIMGNLLKSLGNLLENKKLPNTLTSKEIDRILNFHAPLSLKKHLYLYPGNRIALNPQNIPKLRKIQDFDVEAELNGLANRLKSQPPKGMVLAKKSKTELCNEIVELYYEELKSLIKNYNWESLLEYLIGQNESVTNKRAYDAINTAPSIACYSDIPSRVEKDIVNVQELERTALSIRSLIEIIAAEPPMGDQKINMDDMDKILAITYHIISWAMLSDQIHCELYDVKINILESGRIGVERKNMENMWNPFIRSKTLENIEADIDNFKYNYQENSESDGSISPEVETAFKTEFGLNLTQIVKFNNVLINAGLDQETPCSSLKMFQLEKLFKEKLGCGNEEINNFINLFSLQKREKWEVAPEGFKSSDIWPWRYNRPLSFLKRPLIISPEPEDDPAVLWGPRHVEESERNLVNLVMSGQYTINEKTSQEMKDLTGKIINERGKKFTNKVTKWFEDNSTFQIDSEVQIGPGEKLSNESDLGDVDVLAINHEKKQIYSIECKHVFYGRNPREVQHEIEKFIGETEEDDSWIKKHLKRDSWLKENLENISTIYDFNPEGFQIFSLFLTVREIQIPYLRNLELPFMAFSNLKREGLDVFFKVLKPNHTE